jgi:hypothetical protein
MSASTQTQTLVSNLIASITGPSPRDEFHLVSSTGQTETPQMACSRAIPQKCQRENTREQKRDDGPWNAVGPRHRNIQPP